MQAYETLRDPGKRAQYDALKNTDFDMNGGSGYAAQGPWSGRPGCNPTMDEWETQFDEWLKRMQSQFGEDVADAERIRKERAGAERLARAEAWEREKREAVQVKQRSYRIKKRTEDARHARQAATLRRFWQGRPKFTWQDAAVGAVFCLFTAGLALQWKRYILEVKTVANGGVINEQQREQQEDSELAAA